MSHPVSSHHVPSHVTSPSHSALFSPIPTHDIMSHLNSAHYVPSHLLPLCSIPPHPIPSPKGWMPPSSCPQPHRPTGGNAIKQRQHADGFPLLSGDGRVHLWRILQAMGHGDMRLGQQGHGMRGVYRVMGALTNSWSWLLAKNIWRRDGQSSRRRRSP